MSCCEAKLDRGYKDGKKLPVWLFRFDFKYGFLTHTTKHKTTYAIIPGVSSGKPFWIGRLVKDKFWVTVKDQLGARRIEFDNGSTYFFKGIFLD